MYLDAESAQVRRLGAPEGRSVPERSHRPAHDGLQRTSRTAVQQRDPALQGRRAGAGRQPARVRAPVAATALFTPYSETGPGPPPARCRSPAAASPLGLAPDAEHVHLGRERRRQDLLHLQPRTARRQPVPLEDQHHAAQGARRNRSGRRTVPRTAGLAGHLRERAARSAPRWCSPAPARRRSRSPARCTSRGPTTALPTASRSPSRLSPGRSTSGTVVTRATVNVQPVHRTGGRDQHAAADRQGRADPDPQDHRGRHQAGLHAEPDQLRAR